MKKNYSTEHPISVAPLPPGPWLVFVRKSGDELIAMGASLARARMAGLDVGIVYSALTPSAELEPNRFLPEIRREYLTESTASCSAQAQISQWLAEIGPATIFAPSLLSTVDADRVFAKEVEFALRDAGYEGALWAYIDSSDGSCNRYLDVSSNLDILDVYCRQCPEFDWSTLLKRLHAHASHVSGATAAEGFWAMDHFAAQSSPLEFQHLSSSALSAPQVLYDGTSGSDRNTVSVVIRTRNRPEFLREALESLESQRTNGLEVIVINDGGVPVENVVGQFKGRLCTSLIEHTESVGRAAAANIGIRQATGNWIAILDDDDIYLPGGIDALVSAAQDPGAVYFGKVDLVEYRGPNRRLLRRFGAPYDAALMAFENQIPFIGSLMPRQALLSIGGLDESLECFEDWDLYLRLAEKCPFEFVDQLVAEYRSFNSTFASGKGGVTQQISGLTRIYAKHLRCGEASLLANAHIAVKEKLIPRAIRLEASEAVRQMREVELAQRELLQLKLHELRLSPLHAAEQALRVAVIVVNYNGRHHLEKLIPSLMTTRHVRFDVIVVDNASKDNSVEWLLANWPQVKVIAEQRNHGFGHGNLIGIQASDAGYVALLNSDTVVTPDWLIHLIQPLLLHPEVGATCSQLRLLARPELLNARGGGMSREGFGYDIDAGFPYVESESDADGRPTEVLFPSGAAMLVRKHEFIAMGGFDPTMFMYHEDVDLGWRYWLKGQKVVMCPRSVVFHAFGGTTGVEQGSAWRHVMGNRHNLRTLWKNYDFRRALGATYRLFRGWLRGGHVDFAWAVLSWNLRHAPSTWRARKNIQRDRRISDQELIQRGLISLHVPPQPDLSVASDAARSEPLLENPLLWPGRSSGLGRLGPGWYAPEVVAGLDVRATTGRGFARLKVAAGAVGKLVIKLHVPNQLCAQRAFTISCNGRRVVVPLEPLSFWQQFDIPVQAGPQGMLDLVLDVPSWSSHRVFQNGDMRRLGAFVHQIAFDAIESPHGHSPHSVTVLITTYKRWPVLVRTLEALKRQTWQDFDVVLVDDGSDDGTWENLQAWKRDHGIRMQLQIFTQANTGQGVARNQGLQYARGDLVLFIGDDTIPEPDFVERHVSKHREVGMPCAVVGYTQWDREGMKVTPFLEYVNEGGHQFGYRYMRDGSDVPYTCFYTSNVSLPREILGAQPFDPNFRTYGWEDIDLGLRLSRRGVRIIYNAQARVHHCHPMVLRDFYRRQIKVGNAIGTMYALHPDLVHDPLMPPADRPKLWKCMARIIVPPLLPLANWLDTLGVRLPERLYRLILSDGFWVGRDRSLIEASQKDESVRW